MSQNDFKALIHSMFTAIATGLVISILIILIYTYPSRRFDVPVASNSELIEEPILNEEDPTFSSHISNPFSAALRYKTSDSFPFPCT
jgi:hypothetical protein